MSATTTPLAGGVQPTNARDDWWQQTGGTPSSGDSQILERSLTQRPTPVTRFGAIGNVLVGAALSTAVLAGGVALARVSENTLVLTAYEQDVDAPATPSRRSQQAEIEAPVESVTPLERAQDLKRWLDLADGDLAAVIGVSRRTLTNWRGGVGAYATSSGRVAIVHALVSRLIDALGDAGVVRLWLSIEVEPGKSRLASLADGGTGISKVLQAGSELLFVTPARPRFESGLSDEESAAIVVDSRTSVVPSGSVARRVRRPGVDGRS